MIKQNQRNLDTLFAIEFGQLLENHLLVRSNRDELIGILCSSLGLKNENQLAQIYAGYDVPTTASIFELIRTLNNAEFTERFFNLKSVNLGGQNVRAFVVEREADQDLSTLDHQSQISGQITSRHRENCSTLRSDRILVENDTRDARAEATAEWDVDFDLLNLVDQG